MNFDSIPETKMPDVHCHLDITKHNPRLVSLEIDFIHCTHEPNMGGWAVLRRICDVCCAKPNSAIFKKSNFTSYASARFASRRSATRAVEMIRHALSDMQQLGVGLCERKQHHTQDPLLIIFKKTLDRFGHGAWRQRRKHITVLSPDCPKPH